MRKYRGIRYKIYSQKGEVTIYYYIAGEELKATSYIDKREAKAKAFSAIDFYREHAND